MSNTTAVKKYQEKCDAIMLRPSKEIGIIIRNAAKKSNMSLQKFIIEIVLNYIRNQD